MEKLKFVEDPDSRWSARSKEEFVSMLKEHKNLKKVKFESAEDSDNKLFEKEIKFYTKKIKI